MSVSIVHYSPAHAQVFEQGKEDTLLPLFSFSLPPPVARCFLRECNAADEEDMVRGLDTLLGKFKWDTLRTCIKECYDKQSITKEIYQRTKDLCDSHEREEKRKREAGEC